VAGRVGVLALQGAFREHRRALESVGLETCEVRRAHELEGLRGLVIPGGESTTMSKLAIEFGLLAPIRALVTKGMPAYGSCAGMIMLATEVLDGRPDQRTFGGIDMTVRRNAFGRQVDSFEVPVVLDGLGDEPFHAVFIRAPWVETVGEGVTVLGRVPAGAPAVPVANRAPGTQWSADPLAVGDVPDAAAGRIVAVRQGNLLATSFHPEITGDLRVHRYFVELVRAAEQG